MALLGALPWRLPELRDELDEHLDDHDGAILPHVLMAGYERWAERSLDDSGGTLPEFLQLLDEAYRSGGSDVQELISVSFLEHLPRPGEARCELRDLVGPSLRQQLEVIG